MEDRRLLYAAAVLLLAACRPAPAVTADSSSARPTDPSHLVGASRAPVRPSARATVLFLGTSLTAGLGVDPAQAYPALIQQKLDSAGLRLTVINAGNSGETSAGALARLDWLLQTPPAVLVIETGANDGLRGQDPAATKANIKAIIAHARARDSTIRIALVAMEAMPNLGARYVQAFRAIYPTVAREDHVTLVPFLLTGVAGIDSLNQADGIHPTPVGHRIVANTVWRSLLPILTEAANVRQKAG